MSKEEEGEEQELVIESDNIKGDRVCCHAVDAVLEFKGGGLEAAFFGVEVCGLLMTDISSHVRVIVRNHVQSAVLNHGCLSTNFQIGTSVFLSACTYFQWFYLL